MEEGKRQKQIAGLLNEEMNIIFQRLGLNKDALKKIDDRHHEIKKELVARVRHQLRSIPVLKFFQDDTLDQVFKMEEIFRKIDEEKKDSQ